MRRGSITQYLPFPQRAPSSILVILIIVLLPTYTLYRLSYSYSTSVCRSKEDAAALFMPMEEVMKGLPIFTRQDDIRIMSYIRMKGIVQEPSELEYNLENPEIDPSMGQGQFVRNLFENKSDGFFVECGALDGETRSNTLFMEKELGWRGLLIEGDPKNYDLLVQKNRKAWTAKACLALKPFPHEVSYFQSFNVGKVLEDSTGSTERGGAVKVQCFPFFTLLSYLKVTEVDYFSLDVEGNELDVLKTIPFDSILIKVLSVEFSHIEKGNGEGGKKKLSDFMTKLGYLNVKTISREHNWANDFIFVHPSLKDDFNLQDEH